MSDVRVSAIIMAHPRRKDFIPALLDKLDRPAEVVWDERNDRWDTGRRSWLAVDRTASHGLVLQDDAVIPHDLIAGIEQALTTVPATSPLCLYAGRVRPFRELVQYMVNQAGPDTSWLTMDQIHWGVGIVLPVQHIEPCIEWGDGRPEVPNYDRRIGRWAQHRKLTVYYPWPSLVDHRASPSLVPGRGHSGRHAHRFIGADASVLDRRWDGPVVPMPKLSSANLPPKLRQALGGPRMRFVNTRYPNLHIPQLGVRFRDGQVEVTGQRAIAMLQTSWWRRRGVMLASEVQPPPAPAVAEHAAPAAVEVAVQEPAPAPASGGAGVPTGSSGDVLAWVGDDPDRARQAVEVERQRDRPRTTLLAKLDSIGA